MIPLRDAWTLRRLLTGHSINGDLEAVSRPFRPLADHLTGLRGDDRLTAWNGFLCDRSDAAELVNSLAGVDPSGPPPEAETDDRCATLADLRRLVTDTSWPWPGWLAGGVLNALAADPGTGKTLLGMELARRLWKREDWPDGGAHPFPEGSRTLWVPGDRHYPQLLDLATAYGLPDEALMFNAPPADPVGGLDLDDPQTLAALERRIVAEAPALVIVDTVGMTTERNLCRPEEAPPTSAP